MAKTMIADVQVKSGVRPSGTTWTRYSVRDGNGGYASTFDKATGEFLIAHKGQFVDLEVSDGDRGRDVTGAGPWREPGAARGESGDGGRNRSIARAVALKAAVELVVGRYHAGAPVPVLESVTPDVINTAATFARWLEEADTADDGPPPFDPDEV